ncbi:MAG: M50 family metallopeptidase [Vulcanimicrobiaceae bacterium]
MPVFALINLDQVEKIVTFVVVLSVLVVLHEYGHFLVARLNRVRVLEFALGMGPKIVGWRSPRSHTLYSVRALPLGGYCQMQGEDGKSSEAEQQREFRSAGAPTDDNFQAKSPWQRLAIVTAGPAANFILALAILFFGAIFFGVQSNKLQPLVGPMVANMPAQKAGLRTGDRIVAVNGTAIHGGDQLIGLIHASYGKPLHIAYVRNGAASSVSVTPVHCPPPESDLGCIGFSPVPEYARVGLVEAVRTTASEFAAIAQGTVGSLALIVSHPQVYAGKVSGVVGMGQAAVTIQDFGWGPYLYFAALISFALGLFNLLPLPALDGGRGAFIVAELIRGKPVDPEKEALVHVTGLGVLLALMLVINFYNAVRIFQGKGPF